MAQVQAELAHLFATHGRIPRTVPTDRHPCFLGAEEPDRAALPGRLTLWLAGLGIGHRLIPVRRPQHNGAVERFPGGIAQRWRGEPGGLDALIAVWNAERPVLSRRHRRSRGRAGLAMRRVWALLAQSRVVRQVNRQGKLSVWDHSRSVGAQAAGQRVSVTVDPTTRCAVIRDTHDQVLRELPVPWLTEAWRWAAVAPTDHHAHAPDRSPVT